MNWIVDTKGGPDDDSYEISVMRVNNDHGKKSYGWHGEDKIHISDSGGPNRNSVPQGIWDRLVAVANDVANELNQTAQEGMGEELDQDVARMIDLVRFRN